MLLLILFILVPIAEIAMFMLVGDLIGFWPTLGVVVVTAFIGTYLLRQQGLSVLMQAQNSSAEGKIPVQSIMDGVFLLVAGAFLLTPGILTDIVGFSFMIPAVRRFFGNYLYKKFAKNISVSTFGFDINTPPENRQTGTHHMPPDDGPIIEGEIIVEETESNTEAKDPNKGSPWHKK